MHDFRSEQRIECLLHIGEKGKANVKLFIDNIQSWEKVEEIRLQRMSDLKQQTKWSQVLNSLLSYFQRHHGIYAFTGNDYTPAFF